MGPGMDSVHLQQMAFHAYHGAHPEEKVLGQRFFVDLTVSGDFTQAGRSDDLADAVDYGPIYRAVREIMEGEPVNLLEHLGERICQSVLSLNPRIRAVEVAISKPSAPVAGVLAGATVTIRRQAPETGN